MRSYSVTSHSLPARGTPALSSQEPTSCTCENQMCFQMIRASAPSTRL